MIIGINCGHTLSGTVGSGAVGILNESDETRAVGKILIELLRERGITVVDCTNDRTTSVTENLARICEIANAQRLDAFISLHFNAGGGMGCEAYTNEGKVRAYAGEITGALAGVGFHDRGIKDGSHLYVIKNTTAPACLLEICFVDNKSDAELYQELGARRVACVLCDAIVESMSDFNKENLNMTQYDEIKSRFDELQNIVDRLQSPTLYNYIDENMPKWAIDTIQKLINKGFLKGEDEGFELSEEMLRILVINDRAGLYD